MQQHLPFSLPCILIFLSLEGHVVQFSVRAHRVSLHPSPGIYPKGTVLPANRSLFVYCAEIMNLYTNTDNTDLIPLAGAQSCKELAETDEFLE